MNLEEVEQYQEQVEQLDEKKNNLEQELIKVEKKISSIENQRKQIPINVDSVFDNPPPKKEVEKIRQNLNTIKKEITDTKADLEKRQKDLMNWKINMLTVKKPQLKGIKARQQEYEAKLDNAEKELQAFEKQHGAMNDSDEGTKQKFKKFKAKIFGLKNVILSGLSRKKVVMNEIITQAKEIGIHREKLEKISLDNEADIIMVETLLELITE